MQAVTIEEFASTPDSTDDGLQELVRGRVVVHRPTTTFHGFVCSRVASVLRSFADEAAGCVALRCGYVVERGPDTVLAPDVSYSMPSGSPPVKDWGWPTAPPDLVVEVLDDDRAEDFADNVALYLRWGVRVVWVVGHRTGVEVHTAESIQSLSNDDTLTGGDVLPGFSCPVASLFP